MLPSLHALHPNVTPTNACAGEDEFSMTDEELQEAVDAAKQAVDQLEPEWQRLFAAFKRASIHMEGKWSQLWFAGAGREGPDPYETLEADYDRLKEEYKQAKEAFQQANVPYQAANNHWTALKKKLDDVVSVEWH